MRAAGTPPVHIAGRGQDGGLQLHRGVVQSRPSPFWHPLSIPNRLRDTDAQGGANDLSDKPSTKPGQLQTSVALSPSVGARLRKPTPPACGNVVRVTLTSSRWRRSLPPTSP